VFYNVVKKIYKVFVLCAIYCCNTAVNADNISIISDMETEDYIADIMRPIFKVANLDFTNTKLYIVNEASVNAFVSTDGVFTFTGLITFAQNSDTIFGVMCHETGHLAKQHLSRMVFDIERKKDEALKATAVASILSLGLAPLAMGSMAMAAMFITPMITIGAIQSGTLQYSRNNESEADEAAILYLKKLNKPLSGMYDTMRYFQSQMPKGIEAFRYFFTHPLPQERLERLRTASTSDRSTDVTHIPDCIMEHKLRRVQAKINGFFEKNRSASEIVPKDNTCFNDIDLEFLQQYQLLHQEWKKRDHKATMKIVRMLLRQKPNDIFLQETMANVLQDSGRVKDAVPIYRNILEMAQNNQRLKTYSLTNLGRSLIMANSKETIEEGLQIFQKLSAEDRTNPVYYEMQAMAYNAQNDSSSSLLCQAQKMLVMEKYSQAKMFAALAKKNISKQPEHVRRNLILKDADDVIDACKDKKDQE